MSNIFTTRTGPRNGAATTPPFKSSAATVRSWTVHANSSGLSWLNPTGPGRTRSIGSATPALARAMEDELRRASRTSLVSLKKNVSFCESVIVRETYAAGDYDRSSIDVTPISMAELLAVRAESRAASENALRVQWGERQGVTSLAGPSFPPARADPPRSHSAYNPLAANPFIAITRSSVYSLNGDTDLRRNLPAPVPSAYDASVHRTPKLDNAPPALQPCF
ncbi:hypothetical protein HKX48_008621 [Thoreauomyces humboldtii]|nr:hypothetical protein HKX48_008621 [Thoreauomyces humboldtii]